MHISKVSKSFNEEVSFLFNDDIELWVVFHKISSMIIYVIVDIFTASVVTVLLLRNRKDQ